MLVAGLEDVVLKAAALPEVGLKASAGVQAGSTGTLAADSMVAMAVASTVVGAAASTVAVADTAKPVARSTGFYRIAKANGWQRTLSAVLFVAEVLVRHSERHVAVERAAGTGYLHRARGCADWDTSCDLRI